MIKTRAFVVGSLVAAVLLCSNIVYAAGSPSVAQKKEIIKTLQKEFDDEHDKILKGKIPMSDEEINESAAAGDRLKEKGIEVQKLKKGIEDVEGPAVRSKDEILNDIKLGEDVIGESVENLAKSDPSRSKSNSELLKKLKSLDDEVTNDKISLQDAEKELRKLKGQ